jgi:pimeloyl-ACP methyl ester carboxylesterase
VPFIPAHEIVVAAGATPTATALLLHGILGSRRNWRGFIRHLAPRLPDWRFVLVDHRNHGDSHGAPGPHTLAACARDLEALAELLGGPPEAVLGHSFGGKVALTYARDHHHALSQVWLLDATPDPLADDQALEEHRVAQVIRRLREVDQPLARRDAVVPALTRLGASGAFAAWMTTNLRRDDAAGGYVWRFDLDAVEEMLASYLAADLWPFLEALPGDLEVHIVRGGRSELWTEATFARLEALVDPVTLHTLPDAGHWLHADDPAGLADVIARTLR